MEPTKTKLVPRATPTRPLAVVVRGPHVPDFRLHTGSCTVGSDSECDIVIREPSVSRRHAELTLVAQGVRVRDLGSLNGTFYLGRQVGDIVLGIGSSIELGGTQLFIEADAKALHDDAPFAYSEYGPLIGHSPALRRVFTLLHRLEGSLVTVLIEGESGVGKELVAQAIHGASAVAEGPLVPLNCGAISRDLVASELFGHKRGAFSGATDDRSGAFESADGGTLFLDEIGELPLDLQPILLRALETGEVRRVGGDTVKFVQVRIVAATNRNLEEDVKVGRFRSDLYYRLAVVRLTVPPLRERPEDIVPLAQRFARKRGLESLPPFFLERLIGLSYPGNVRELRNLVDAFVAIRAVPNQPDIAQPSSDLSVDTTRPYLEQRDELVDRFTRSYLQGIMSAAGYNQRVAAKVAGLDRSYFGRLVAKYGIRDRGS